MAFMFPKKTLRQVPLDNKIVLVRADYNVPLNDDGTIADDYRMLQSLPTLKYLLSAGCKIIITSHLGRPDGKVVAKESLEPVATHLGELLGQPVGFVPDCVGDRVKVASKRLKPGGVLLLENVRFHPEEEKNDEAFAKNLAADSGAQYFVQDGFGVVHRAHASTDAVTHFLPSVAGLLLEKEVSTILEAMQSPKRPLVAVLGGAKVSDKIKILERFVTIADQIVIGGAMANTFLKYKGLPVGKSVCEEGQEAEIDRIYALVRQKVGDERVDDFLLLPSDVVVATEISPNQKRVVADTKDVKPDEYILDLGTKSIEAMLAHCQKAKTVVWNGTLGYAEYVVFAYASAKLAMFLAEHKDGVFSLVGGGDTADFVVHWDAKRGKSFGHVSTGGGASLELMAGDKLPGVEALLDA
jgi:phosphoglycerate kinase